jgi:hypothetical protein
MRPLERFKRNSTVAMLALIPAGLFAQALTHEGNRWVQTITGTAPAASRIRVIAQGPVHVEGGGTGEITFTAKLSVQVRREDDARRILSRYAVRIGTAPDTVVLSSPGGPVTASLTVKAPRLSIASVNTSDGVVEVNGVDGNLDISTEAGEVKCDRIAGLASLITGGGDIRVGAVQGNLHASTAGGRIIIKTVRGDAVLETAGGDIEVTDAGATVRADTAGGSVRIGTAGGSVNATSGGGSISVGKSGGVVVARNMAGPVQVGAAAGLRCESGTGGIRVSNVSGPMRVTTSVGSIVATLLGGATTDSFLATGNGDITVMIPSNVGVTIRAESDLADTLRRIVSEFPGLSPQMKGTQVVAEGPVNGGGPLLRIAGTGGTIFIKRQP